MHSRRSSRTKVKDEISIPQSNKEQEISPLHNSSPLNKEEEYEFSDKDQIDTDGWRKIKKEKSSRKRGRQERKTREISFSGTDEKDRQYPSLPSSSSPIKFESDDTSSSSSLSYDQQRQLNIKRNAEQMRLLQIPTLLVKQSILNSNKKYKSPGKPKEKKLTEPTEPMRRSLRTAGLHPEGGLGLAEKRGDETKISMTSINSRECQRKEGELKFSTVKVVVRGRYSNDAKAEEDEEKEDQEQLTDLVEDKTEEEDEIEDPLINQITQSFTSLSVPRSKSSSSSSSSSTSSSSASSRFSSFPLTTDRISSFDLQGITSKMTKRRVSCLSFHPYSNINKSILLAGDRSGSIGIISYINSTEISSSPCLTLQPFSGPVEDFLFCRSLTDSNRLFICSQDGSIRYFDIENQSFGESFVNLNEIPLMSMTSNDTGNIIYASDKKGNLLTLDAHSNSLELISSHQLSNVKIGCVHICPNNDNILATASNDRLMRIYDARKINKPIHQFQHGYAVTSAYWSPNGTYLASTCIDNLIRIWSIKDQPSSPNIWDVPLKQRHDCHTGRWVTQFRAKWLNGEEGLVIGNMKRAINVYVLEKSNQSKISNGKTGEGREKKKVRKNDDSISTSTSNNNRKIEVSTLSVTELRSPDMSAIPASIAIHPTVPIIAGATASAYAYLWKE